jgi:hypothetical protein
MHDSLGSFPKTKTKTNKQTKNKGVCYQLLLIKEIFFFGQKRNDYSSEARFERE